MLDTVFIKQLNFRKNSCKLNEEDGVTIPHKYINIYVKITSNCNANCKFCEYHSKKHVNNEYFDFIKFENILLSLEAADIHIHKISFTGGEPSMYCNKLAKCLNSIFKLRHKPFIVVNSNGFKLNILKQFKEIDSISLSRHSINEVSNYGIFGSLSVATLTDIEQYKGTNIHLTCNLIKGHVDSEKTIITYLEKAAALGIYDVGFVSLMKINDFCSKYHVDFNDITFNSASIVCNKEWSNSDKCRCRNFIYLPDKGEKVVKFYSRYRCKNTQEAESNYIYDGEYLRSNFAGNIIH